MPLIPFDGQLDEEPMGKLAPFDGELDEEPKKKKAGIGTAIKSSFANVGNMFDLAGTTIAGGGAALFGDEEEALRLADEMEARRKSRNQWANPEGLELDTLGKVAGTVATLPMQMLGMGLSPVETTRSALESGETNSAARKAGLIDAAGNAIGIAIPNFKQATMVVRAGSGAVANVVQELVTKKAIQSVMETDRGKQVFAPNMDDAIVSGIIGGGLGAAMGRAPKKSTRPVDKIRAEAKKPVVASPDMVLDPMQSMARQLGAEAPIAEATGNGVFKQMGDQLTGVDSRAEGFQPTPRIPDQLNLFDQFDERSPVSKYQTEMAPDMWRVDENGIPIRADLSMELQNLQEPLQRNLFGDELDANFPRDPNKPLDMETGDIDGVERFSDPVQFRNDPEGQIPLTEAIDSMPEGVRARNPDGSFAGGTTRQNALGLLRRELFPDNDLKTAVQDADMQQWLQENPRPEAAKQPLGSRARKTGWKKRQGGGVLQDPFGRIPESSDKLQDQLQSVRYRFQALESLPNKDKVTYEQIKQVVNREGVSGPEKQIIQNAYAIALFTSDKNFVTAREFVNGLNDAIQDLTLSKNKSTEYSTFGLDRLDRDAGEVWEQIPRAEWTPGQLSDWQEYNIFPERKVFKKSKITPETTVWENDAALSEGNKEAQKHFELDHYVGHTRNFKEDGVRHVVEIQSDLLQSKTPGSKYTVEEIHTMMDKRWEDLEYIREVLKELKADPAGRLKEIQNWVDRRDDVSHQIATLQNELTYRGGKGKDVDMLKKNWAVRLIREELGDAARQGEKTVRFASADTMAKVEGWVDHREQAARDVPQFETMVARLEEMGTAPEDLAIYRRDLEEARERLNGSRFDPQVQGIYDRYQKEVSKYLMSIGGKPVTDSKGHTWIEVPVEPHRRRPIMFGQRGMMRIDWSDERTKMETELLKSEDGTYIPKNPDTATALEQARTEKDGKLWTYTQSGSVSAAMKTGSTLIKTVGNLVQAAGKRADLATRKWVLPAEQALRKLSRQEITDLGDIFKDEMFQDYRYDGDVLAKHLSVKQLEAYTKMRDVFDATLSAQNEARVAKGQKPITAKEAYVSSRWQGDFRIPVYDANEKLVWYIADTTKRGADNQLKALLAKEPTLKAGKPHTVKSLRGGADIQSMYSTMLDILGRDDPAVQRVKELVEMDVGDDAANMLAQEKHFKTKTGVRGFTGDRPGFNKTRDTIQMFEQQIQYAKNAFQWSEMQKNADDLKMLLTDEQLAKTQENNMKFAREYVKNALGNGESQMAKAFDDTVRFMGVSPAVLDRAVGGVKSFFITQKLAVSAGYTLSNLVQTTNMVPYLANLAEQGYKANPAKAMLIGYTAAVPMAVAHYMRAFGGGEYKTFFGDIPDKFIEGALKYAEDNGITSRSIYDEAPISTGFNPLQKVERAAGFTISAPETVVRSAAFLTYAYYLKDSGKFKNAAEVFQKAEDLVNMSMVDYRATEKPLMFSKGGTLGSVANTLQTYPISFYNQYKYMLNETLNGKPAGLATMLVMQGAIAGAAAVPYFEDTLNLYKMLKNNLLSDSTWAKAMSHPFFSDPKLWMLENLGESAVYGHLSTQTGLGLTSRLTAPSLEAMSQAPFAPAMDMGKQALNLGKAVLDPTNTSKVGQAAMGTIPTGLQGWLETQPFMKDITFVENEDGTKTFMKNSDLADRKGGYTRTEDEVDIRKWGLRSQREVLSREVNWASQEANMETKERITGLVEKIYDAARQGNTEKVTELRQLLIDLTGKDISSEQLQNQILEEQLDDVSRNVRNSKSPQQMLNTARSLKLLENR